MPEPRVIRAPFGRRPDGTEVTCFTVTNARGSTLEVLDHGAIIRAIRIAAPRGDPVSVVLGYPTLAGYLASTGYAGALVGRCANRIRDGRFTIDGQMWQLDRNAWPHHLHGGSVGFDRAGWNAAAAGRPGASGVRLRLLSPAGDQGYPGAVEASVRYLLTDLDEVEIEAEAVTDAPTHVNLVQHSYFNLAGAGTVLDHELRILATHYTPTDREGIPTGDIAPVAGTALDFRRARTIGARIAEVAGGYDHNYVLSDGRTEAPAFAAELRDPRSGRTLRVTTTAPGLQLWTDNIPGAVGPGRHAGVCLEAQHFPDAANQPTFPGTLLRPGERYRTRTVWAFTT